jgi:nucleotide-binding universal stress UspA family protein
VNTRSTRAGRVIAATDFSPDGNAAVRQAGELARRSGRALSVVHVIEIPTPVGPTIISPVRLRTMLGRARAGVADLIAEIRRTAPALEVATVVKVGRPAEVLIRMTGADDTVVLGARGHGGYPGLPHGSVCRRVRAGAAGQVVVAHRASTGTVPAEVPG